MIRLQFVHGDSFSADSIAWFGGGLFSHVDAVMPDGRLLGARSSVIQSFKAGVQIRTADYARFTRRVVFRLDATKEQTDAFYQFLTSQIGKPYDSKAIWGFVFARDWRITDSWICSELQAAAVEYSKLCPKLYLSDNRITPNAFVLVMSALGAIVES